MEKRDIFYLLFWSFAIAFTLYFLGFGNAPFFFAMSLVGSAFVEKLDRAWYALGVIFLSLAFAFYFKKTFIFIGKEFLDALLFLFLPFMLFEIRKRIKK